jgi:CheY-like chemotaxis protein
VPKKVLLVGHCGPDSSYLRMAVRKADQSAQVLLVEDESKLLKALGDGADLVLINRVLDYGFAESGGIELIARLRALHPAVKFILISNFKEAQQSAMNAGALRGFGKGDIGSPAVTALLREGLGAQL